MDAILQRLQAQNPGLLEVLSERLSGSELQSLLLEVSRRRAAQQSPARLLEDQSHNRFCPPAALSPERLHALEGMAHKLLQGVWQPVVLSPVCPLGTCSSLANVSQNVVVSAGRRTEVVADPTNVLALECALRRRRDRQTEVGLFTSHRVLRAQRFEGPGMLSHFHVFALCTAGRVEPGFGFELRTLTQMLTFMVQLCLPVSDRIEVALTPLNPRLIAGLEQLRIEGARVRLDLERTQGRDYYRQVCFKLRVDQVEIGDGGFTDWTQQLLVDRKERLLTGGLGVDRLAQALEAPLPDPGGKA